MFDQLAAKVVGFQIIVRAERMHDPHLIPGAAGGDVEPLLKSSWSRSESAPRSAVSTRK